MFKRSILLILVFILNFTLFPQMVHGIEPGISEEYTKRYDKDGNRITDPNETPHYIQFNSDYRTDSGDQSIHYKQYGNKKLWEEYYHGRFHWYTIVPKDPAKRTPTNQHMYYMYENRQTKFGKNQAWKLVDRSYSTNLKLGRVLPNTQHKGAYQGDGSGTTYITAGKYEGNNYEWRYLGYSSDGVPVNNPFFPPDYPSKSPQDWSKKVYVDYSWKKRYQNGTNFDSSGTKDPNFLPKYSNDYTIKEKAIAEYFIPKHPEFRIPGKSDIESARHWAKYFSMKSDPRISSKESREDEEGFRTYIGWQCYY